jgi:hypothetical protein
MTIEFQPSGYIAYGSGQSLVYIVYDALYANNKFRYIAQVYVDGSVVAKLKALPNSNNKGVFDIANIARDYIAPQVHFNTTNFAYDENGSRQVYVRFGYEYAPSATTTPTETLNLATSTALEVTSGVYQLDTDDYGVLFVDDYKTNPALNLSPFLSLYNIPSRRVIEVSENDWGTLSLFRPTTSQSAINLAIQFYDANGTLIPDGASQYGLLTGAFNPITGIGMAHVGLFPENLRAFTNASPSSGSVNPDDYPGWASYRIQLSTQLSFTLMTFVRRNPCADRVRFAWWNSLGAWDFINAYGREMESEQVERKTFRTYGGNAFTANTTYTHTAQEGMASGGRTHRTKQGRVNTNWLPEWMNPVVADFFASPLKYVQVGDKWLPITLERDTIEFKRQKVDKVFEYEFTYTYVNPLRAIG